MATAGKEFAVAAADSGGWPKRPVVATATRVLLALVFCGWLMIWVVMPTNTYRQKWQPKIREDTDSTYFGSAGANLLILTFPIMFISVVGCVYLHYEQKRNASHGARISRASGISSRLTAWRRPFLMKGPLGIVSYTEAAFFAMFIVLIVWCFSCWLQIGFSNINNDAAAKAGEEVWEMKMESAGLRLGLVGNLCTAFLFFPVTRGSSLLPLVGLTSEASVRYHIWVGHIVMSLFTGHGVCYFIYWAATGNLSEILKWAKVGASNIAGELSLLSGLVLWVATIPKIRRKMFELFFYTHQLYTLFLLFFILHVGMGHFNWILPGVFLFMVDRYLRFLQSRQKVRLVSARLLPGETMELNFAKSPGFQYTTTSVVFINVPSLSKLQWHPFTVSSSSGLEPERLSVIIKREGRWTQKLYQMLNSPTAQERLDVSVEGPYGPISDHFLKYDDLVLVSGGSGITPFVSIIRELIFRATTLNSAIPKVRLICAFKTSADLNMLDLILPASGGTSDISLLQLHIEAFVTREKEPTLEAKKHIRTIWFKPSGSDLPLSPVLGPNSWLWLGVVISTSFIAFLLLLGIVYRYYIYPIDKNTNKVYSSTAKSLLYSLFICVCIIGGAGTAFLWNKRRAVSETNQVRITSAPSPVASPGSLFHNVDQELESLPTESLVQVTKVHYGARPDLKKILLEYEEPNTGVFVSGPASMRREVATVCGSGLVDNLHFEALSFSW